ncbi:PA0069 family radical SAM protein [Kamptonema cortianum]|nr:PA0069 family radical SAM protein [Oscillatoria laete-virens]MDK3157194.1 PA0069 family radical SAM protein [Kamptonema cortianum]MDL5054443.1 PA0069 family radical SAM protein [Oscillatoria laete-virens NRMC-F 0139]
MNSSPESFPKGRGTSGNPPNRFEQIHLEADPDCTDGEESPSPATKIYHDRTQTLITYNDSPDLGFSASVNPYRGCEHGCAYCYARPFHEYLGLSAGLDFETRIMAKLQAPEILRRELSAPRWTPQVISFSGVTDCYQPIERQLRITRECLDVCAEFRNPVAIVTKNALVTRDLDILRKLRAFDGVAVFVSVTTLNAELAGRLEPRASRPAARLEAIAQMAQAGIPVGVMVAPVIPALNDHEIPRILSSARKHGAQFANFVLLRLPHGVKDIFTQWLDTHEPLKKEKVLAQIRDTRGGGLYNADFAQRMSGTGIIAEQIAQLFRVSIQRTGMDTAGPHLSVNSFQNPHRGEQLHLF